MLHPKTSTNPNTATPQNPPRAGPAGRCGGNARPKGFGFGSGLQHFEIRRCADPHAEPVKLRLSQRVYISPRLRPWVKPKARPGSDCGCRKTHHPTMARVWSTCLESNQYTSTCKDRLPVKAAMPSQTCIRSVDAPAAHSGGY